MEQVPQDLHRYKRWLCTLLAIIIVGYLAVQESPQAIGNENSLRDTSVIEAVLIDLLSRSNSPIEPKNETPRILYFSPEAVGQEIDREAVLSTTDATAFDNLSTKQLMRVREAADHLIRRVKRNEPFTDFQPKDSRIKLYSTNIDRRHFRKRRFNLPQIFRAYPPGYSRDSELAIVRLSFTWSGNMHGAAGLYVLTKRNDGWAVLFSDLMFFI